MTNQTRSDQQGFSAIELAVVVLLVGLVIAIASPQIANAMREHRLGGAVREVIDVIQRAKAQAMADNKTSSVIIDTTANRLGLIYQDSAGNTRTEYMPMPDGISFEKPAGVTAPMAGAPTSKAVSFPAQGNSKTLFQQDFNSRGFPAVASPTTVHALYIGNGESYRAITMTSVGGIRTWWWEDNKWVAASK